MQIAIDIDKELYEDIKEHGLCGYCSDLEIVNEAIANGTPLPEGHGDLINKSKIYEAILAEEDNDTNIRISYNNGVNVMCFLAQGVHLVIEADKEEREDKE